MAKGLVEAVAGKGKTVAGALHRLVELGLLCYSPARISGLTRALGLSGAGRTTSRFEDGACSASQ